MFLFILNSYQFFIKNYHEDIFMCDKAGQKAGKAVTVCQYRDKLKIYTNHDSDGNLTIHNDNNDLVLSISEDQKLVLDDYTGEPNQKFVINLIKPNMFVIKSGNDCVEYLPSKFQYQIRTCNISNHQLFSVVDENNISHQKGILPMNIDEMSGFPLYGDRDVTYRSSRKSDGSIHHIKLHRE